jgi:DNA-binding CsgD family transcriptional regulator
MAEKLYQNILWLRKRYHMDKKTPQEIAKECGVSKKTIYSYLDRFGLRKLK